MTYGEIAAVILFSGMAVLLGIVAGDCLALEMLFNQK